MAWPGVADFSSAIQNPGQSLADWELTQGELAVYERGGRTGMPIVSSGNFAAVYRISSESRSHAVRCFTRAVNDQRDRYTNLDAYLKSTHPPAFVEFEYLEKGIRVAGVWYPIVKMEWVNGMPLDKYVRDNLDKPEILQGIAARWRGVVSSLRSLNIAHNDLQHGNVMVQTDRSIRLVDYDAMYLPDYLGQTSPENGHQNFQHPLKTSKNYNESIDNFPALVIYVSLLAIAADPGLFDKFYNDDNLLFRKADYGAPANSACFQVLKSNPDDTVRQLVAQMERFCSAPVEDVPILEEILNQPSGSVPDRNPAPAPAAAPVPSPTGSLYRDLLNSSQPQAPTHAQASAVAVVALTCRGCGQSNPADFIYCENAECIAPLQTGSQFCAGCGMQIPSNAVYCRECGRPT
jgi:serine/threonine protein kinase